MGSVLWSTTSPLLVVDQTAHFIIPPAYKVYSFRLSICLLARSLVEIYNKVLH